MDTNHAESSFSSDDTTDRKHEGDNLNTDVQENSANGMDSVDVRGGENGRNIRGMGSQDMDSQHGVLRQNDTSNGAMEVTEEAKNNAAASDRQTQTSTTSVTTSGPDDYASDKQVDVPNAQKAAKEQDEKSEEEDNNSPKSDEEVDEDVAETGTSIDHQPTY